MAPTKVRAKTPATEPLPGPETEKLLWHPGMITSDVREKGRALLLGPEFKPKTREIDTPDFMLERGFPPESLILVGFVPRQGVSIRNAANGDETTFSGLCVIHALRWRDAERHPVLSGSDLAMLADGQDLELLNTLGGIVMDFLGVNKTVTDVKNSSAATQSAASGSESHTSGDSAVSMSAETA